MQVKYSDAVAIIPARLDSSRFPNKILQKIDGIPIINRVILNVLKTEIFDRVVVATDDKRVIEICDTLGVESFFMDQEVSCGSERSYYVWRKYPNYRWYVSFPADEPMLDPLEIQKMWQRHLDLVPEINDYIRTCYSKFYSPERIELARTCKIVSNQKDYVMYFSRSPIPFIDNGFIHVDEYKKHVGVFIFNNQFFKDAQDNLNHGWKLSDIWISPLSKREKLEQLAFLENGLKVRLVKLDHKFHGVDIQEDIDSIEELLK